MITLDYKNGFYFIGADDSLCRAVVFPAWDGRGQCWEVLMLATDEDQELRWTTLVQNFAGEVISWR